ncbi:tRNA lysidine(34) synthetase TilS, partial [Acidocella sp. MX-AZ02]|uniref:tRNA lysidine(34) synthetase TilS n=2 Tax=unclassified Acidocella TaxID=2648610 RepID=UPI00028D14DD
MLLNEVFAAALSRLLPHSTPRLALGVSGGADSTALVLLADEYCRPRGGAVLALILDHGLRAGSAAEAQLTASRLAQRGIAAKIITLALAPGPGLQARAREARHAALAEAARQAGFLYLALGHHAADQRETVAMRAARGEGGVEGMAAWTARRDVVLLRPLLRTEPEHLRAYLTDQGMGWVEDPSNLSRRFERVR